MEMKIHTTLTLLLRALLHTLIRPLMAVFVDRRKKDLKEKDVVATATASVTATASTTALPTTTTTVSTTAVSPSPSSPSTTTTTTTTTTLSTPRPIPNSYWATPHLLACEYPYNPKFPALPQLRSLLSSGVRTFIDLTEPGELVPYHALLPGLAAQMGLREDEVKYFNFPIRDRTPPPSSSFLAPIMQVLKAEESANRISAVHCRGGIGRTGTVVCCWLIESQRVTCGKDALDAVASQWRGVAKCKRYPNSPETGPQCDFVRNWRGVGAGRVVSVACN